ALLGVIQESQHLLDPCPVRPVSQSPTDRVHGDHLRDAADMPLRGRAHRTEPRRIKREGPIGVGFGQEEAAHPARYSSRWMFLGAAVKVSADHEVGPFATADLIVD